VATRALATKAAEGLRYRSTVGAEDEGARTPIVDMVAVGVVFAAGDASDADLRRAEAGDGRLGIQSPKRRRPTGMDGRAEVA